MQNSLCCDLNLGKRILMVTPWLAQKAAAIASSIRPTNYTMTGAVSAAKKLGRGSILQSGINEDAAPFPTRLGFGLLGSCGSGNQIATKRRRFY